MSNNTGFPYVSYQRPTTYWDVICRHLPLALVTGIPFILTLIITPEKLPLRPCTFKALTGFPCPFCGFTRSFWFMASGDWAHTFYQCPLGCILFVFCILVFAFNLAGLLAGVKLFAPKVFKIKKGQGKYLTAMISLLFIANWGYRLLEGLK